MNVKAIIYAIISIPIIVGLFIASILVGYFLTIMLGITILFAMLYYSFKVLRED